MRTRPAHYRTHRRSDLTPRQREVLALVAKGRTNAEIASDLGLGYESVKTHISAILDRLEVSSREEAADWWREQSTWRARVNALPVRPLGLPTILATGAMAAVVIIAVLAFALPRGDESPTPTRDDSLHATPSATAPATSATTTSTVAASPSPATSPSPAPSATPAATPVVRPTAPATSTVNGLFSEPGAVEEGTLVSVTLQPSQFPAPTGAAIFDTQAGSWYDLGPGQRPIFSPGGTKAAWLAGEFFPSPAPPLKVIDLATGDIREYGTGISVRWLSETELRVAVLRDTPGPNKELERFERLDLVTGAREDFVEPEITIDPMGYAGGFDLEFVYFPPTASSPHNGTPLAIRRISTGEELIRLEANRAIIVDDNTVVIATPLVDEWTNLFTIDLTTREATYIATVDADENNWPLAAGPGYIAWTDGFCDDDTGPTRVYDRRTGEITTFVGTDWWVVPAGDHMLIGAFGGNVIFDPIARTTVASVPPGQTVWTSDFRYAAQGLVGGHGGLCAA